MKSAVSVEHLKHSLKKICTALNGRCEYFPFFGSLLGLVRDNGPIVGDDDVDIYVNKKDFTIIKSIIKDFGFEIDFGLFPNQTEHLLQVKGIVNGKYHTIDFYFYDDESDPYFIQERWNFPGIPTDINNVLRIPKPLIFPLKQIDYENIPISIPHSPEILCEFLYGVNWRTPQKKDMDYKIVMLGGRPIRLIQAGTKTNFLA